MLESDPCLLVVTGGPRRERGGGLDPNPSESDASLYLVGAAGPLAAWYRDDEVSSSSRKAAIRATRPPGTGSKLRLADEEECVAIGGGGPFRLGVG